MDPAAEVFPTADGQVYLLIPGGDDLVIEEPDELDRVLLERLAAPVEVHALVAELGVPADVIERKLADLDAADLLRVSPSGGPELSPTEEERFARQLPYLADAGNPAAQQKRLRDARVLLLGCGGLGTWALSALASAGIGSFVLVDDDVVELSNLNRQVLYTVADLGRRKVQCSAEWATRFDPSIEVDSHVTRIRSRSDVAALLGDVDVLVLAADWPPYLLGRWVNRACLAAGVPFVTAGQVPPVLKIGPTFVPGRSPCFECHETGLREAFPLYDELVERRAADPAPATTLGAASAIAGSMLALEVIHLLVDLTPVATEGRAMILDMRTLSSHWEELPRHPSCPACGTSRRLQRPHPP